MNFAASILSATRATAKGFVPLALLILFWQWAGCGSVNFPQPSRSLAAVQLLSDSGALRPALVATLVTIMGGLAGACALGFGLGLAIGTSAAIRRWSSLVLEFIRALPPPIVIPITVLFGYSGSMEISVITVAASWPILLNTIAGIEHVNPLVLDVAHSFKLSWRDRLTKIIIPSVVPYLLAGIRIAMPLSIVLALLVEMMTGLPGLGVLMIQGQRDFDSSQVFGVLGVVAILGYSLHLMFAFTERLILRNRTG